MRQTIVAAVYGLAVIASGMVRYFGQEGGATGLWFGLIMGLLAITAAIFFHFSKKILGHCLIWSSLLVVGGWFVYEALIKKGLAEAEPRQLMIIGISIVVAIVMTKSNAKSNAKSNVDP